MENMTNVIVENEKDLENVVELVEEVLTDSPSIEVVKGTKGSKVALAIAGVGIAAAIGYKVYNHFKKKKAAASETDVAEAEDLDEDYVDVEIDEETTE